MKVDIRSSGGQLASLAGVALRSFVATVLVLTLAGGVLAGLSYYFLREHHAVYAVIAAAVALIESVTVGVVLGAKRALVMAVAQGLSTLRLGRSFVHLVFERMPDFTAVEGSGERGNRIARGLERLPLARAEALLSGAVRSVTGDPGEGGWLRQGIQARLSGAVQRYTLVRFREEGANHGGIDLPKMREELGRTVDDELVRRVRGGLQLWTALTVVGLPFVVAVQTWVIILLLHSKG
jgi:hypothetical protein